jgi:hypothetical protein
MSKPICVIYFPFNYRDGISNESWIYDYARFLNGISDSKFQQNDYFKDYYWFCFYKYEIEEPEFKVFYEKDFNEIKYEELKKLIIENLCQKNYKTT